MSTTILLNKRLMASCYSVKLKVNPMAQLSVIPISLKVSCGTLRIITV